MVWAPSAQGPECATSALLCMRWSRLVCHGHMLRLVCCGHMLKLFSVGICSSCPLWAYAQAGLLLICSSWSAVDMLRLVCCGHMLKLFSVGICSRWSVVGICSSWSAVDMLRLVCCGYAQGPVWLNLAQGPIWLAEPPHIQAFLHK